MTEAVPTLVATRRALHVVAEHVLLPDLHDATCRIGLRVEPPATLGTPTYPRGAGTRRLRLDGTDVVDERDGREVARVALDRPLPLGEVRARLGLTAAAPADIYDLGSPGDPDRPVVLDPDAQAVLREALVLGQRALEALSAEAAAERDREEGELSSIQWWPEHLDVACSIDRVTFGASPGDDEHPEPYLYVAPWGPPPAGPFWDEPFGASRPAPSGLGTDAALAFFREGRARLGPAGR